MGSTVAQYSRYLGVSVGGFVIYLFLLTTLIKLIAIPYLVADLVAVSVGGIWNFLGSEIYAFGFGSSDILFGD
ncbi:MAG: GtrA family protein [Halobacteria archaeon]|nr:GtrA family protein [Halobacteria archaeon]